MNKLLSALGAFCLIVATSCTDGECTAYAEDGTPMFKVVGNQLCEDQIQTASGEYCDCDSK